MVPARRILDLALVSAARVAPRGRGLWTQAGYVRFAHIRTTVNGDLASCMLTCMLSNWQFFISFSQCLNMRYLFKHVSLIQIFVLHSNMCPLSRCYAKRDFSPKASTNVSLLHYCAWKWSRQLPPSHPLFHRFSRPAIAFV